MFVVVVPQVGSSTVKEYHTYTWALVPESYTEGTSINCCVIFQGKNAIRYFKEQHSSYFQLSLSIQFLRTIHKKPWLSTTGFKFTIRFAWLTEVNLLTLYKPRIQDFVVSTWNSVLSAPPQRCGV